MRYSTYLPIAHHMQKKVARIWILASASASANFGVVTEGAYELRIAGAHELRIWHQISDLSMSVDLNLLQVITPLPGKALALGPLLINKPNISQEPPSCSTPAHMALNECHRRPRCWCSQEPSSCSTPAHMALNQCHRCLWQFVCI